MLVTNFKLKYSLYRVVLAAFQLFDTGRLHPMRERAIRALNKSVDYIETQMPNAIGFETKKELLIFSLDNVNVSGYYTEFGVFSGGTIRFMAKKNPQAQFHGFDSFEGLPEAWSGTRFTKATFTLKGKLPKVPVNVTLHKGWFSDSLPQWRQSHHDKIAFIHIDCDLYSSTLDILNNLKDKLQVGTVILFDEYFNYSNWENHEFKAWQEFISQNNIGYQYLGFARQQVAVRISALQ